MLAEQRYNEIIKLLEERGNITVGELTVLLHASEATVRRDLASLDKTGKLKKVFGGAVLPEKSGFMTKDTEIGDRELINVDEKRRIAEYAARLIKEDDFVYIDAGSTTGFLADFINQKKAVYVTNGVGIARKLAKRGFDVILLGGNLKYSTDAVTGATAVANLLKYRFTIGFWGTNGIDLKTGYTTPDSDEAAVKRVSMEQTGRRYVLCDHDKFGVKSMVSFGNYDSAKIITDRIGSPEFEGKENIKETGL